jgi:hypothetical protein
MNSSFTGQNIAMAFEAVRAGYGTAAVPASPVRTEYLEGALRQLDVEGGRQGWRLVNISRAEGIEWALDVRAGQEVR